MRLALNLSRIPEVGGLRVFAETVLSELRDRSNEIEVVAPAWMRPSANGFNLKTTPEYLASSANISRLRPILWWFYSALFFPIRRGVPLFALTHHVVPFRSRQAVTVHDLRPLYAPDSAIQALYFRHMLPHALHRCDGVITVSHATKDLLVKEYRVAPERIHVVSNCVDLSAFTPLTQPDTKEDTPFLLLVGASWSHKNPEEVIDMASTWKDRYRIVMISPNPDYRARLTRRVDEAGLSDRVELLPAQSRDKMIWFYQHCAALVYPSKMEGFGIPPLEAMACRRPVILSDIPVFRELYGDVPIYVTLGDKSSWTVAIDRLQDQSAIAQKIEAGFRKAREFTPERTKRELLNAIDAIWGAA